MFGKLFGGKKAEPEKKAPDVQATLGKLQDQGDVIQSRIKKLEVEQKELQKKAIEKKKNGDTRGALMQMKLSKMREKELAKCDGQLMLIEQQQIMMQQANSDQGVTSTLREATDAIKELNKQNDVDALQDLKDDLDDQQAIVEETQDFFANVAKEGEDELMDELEELEALAVESEMADVEVSAKSIAGQTTAAASKQPAKQQEEEEEDDEAQLAKLMA